MLQNTLLYKILVISTSFFPILTVHSQSIVIPNSEVTITGQTNFGAFNLNYHKQDIWPIPSKDSILSIILPLHEFTTSKEFIKNDFLQLLKYPEYSSIEIIFPSHLPLNNTLNHHPVTIYAIIKLAGIEKEEFIIAHINTSSVNTIGIYGTIHTKLSYYNLLPTEKYYFIVSIKDDVLINFKFYFNQVNISQK